MPVSFRRAGPWPEVPPERLSPRILTAGWWIATPPWTPRYRVRGLHYCLLLGGALRFMRPDGRVEEARAGDFVWYGAGVNQVAATPGAPLSLYQLHWHAAAGALEDGVPVVPPLGTLPHRFAVGARQAELVAQWERLIQALLQATPTWPLAAASAALEIHRLACDAAFHRRRLPPLRLDPWDRLLARLEEDAAPPRVADLARDLRLGADAFIRAFRRRTGHTPKQYLQRRRLWRGRRALLQGSSAKQAALAAGFADPLYFSRCYRRLFGHPPSRARASPDPAGAETAAPLPISRHVCAPGVDLRYFAP